LNKHFQISWDFIKELIEMKVHIKKFVASIIARTVVFWMIVLSCNLSQGQQYSSDSWLSKPYGTMTVIPTFGQKSSMLMTTYSLLPKWEFTMAVWIYDFDNNASTNDDYTTSFYAKYMFYQNTAETGGSSVKFGTGLDPGVLTEDGVNAFQSYWVNFPTTIPLFNNKVSWDIMPGLNTSIKNSIDSTISTSFTYTTRLAWYCFGPKLAIVGEVFGSEGQTANKPDYRIGLRWEPGPHAAFAVTYSKEFTTNSGAGFEFGIMLFSPPFVGLGKNRKSQFTE
jgi:hypothetical protein